MARQTGILDLETTGLPEPKDCVSDLRLLHVGAIDVISELS
jgi:hypothetical protein